MVNTEVAKAKKKFCSEFSVRTLEGDKDLNHCLDPKNEQVGGWKHSNN